MTPDEMQRLLNCGALELWALEDLVGAEGTEPMKALLDSLHLKASALAAVLVKDYNLSIPTPSTRSGGGGK